MASIHATATSMDIGQVIDNAPKPGAGLGKKVQSSQGRHVKIAEANKTELVVGPSRETAAANVVEHEISMVQLDRVEAWMRPSLTPDQSLWR